MTVTVPSTGDPVNYEMFNSITALTAAITAAGSNGPLVFQLTKQKAAKQRDLVLSLIGSGKIAPSAILSSESYGVAQDGGESRQ